jgi:hypothetical protein
MRGCSPSPAQVIRYHGRYATTTTTTGDDVEPQRGDVVGHQLRRSDTLVGLQQQQQQQVMMLNLNEGM